MLRIKDIPTIYDQCENKDLRCLVALPNDSQTYILDDYDEGWDWETEQATYETDLVLVNRDTLVVKRVTFDNDKKILRDENHIRVLEDRTEEGSRISSQRFMGKSRQQFLHRHEEGSLMIEMIYTALKNDLDDIDVGPVSIDTNGRVSGKVYIALRTDVVMTLKDNPIARTVPVVIVGVECLVTPDVDLDLVNITLGGALAPLLDDLARQVCLHSRSVRHETISPNIVPVDRIEVEAIRSELNLLLHAAVGVCSD